MTGPKTAIIMRKEIKKISSPPVVERKCLGPSYGSMLIISAITERSSHGMTTGTQKEILDIM